MKIALIGATGFVGKAVLEELIQRRHQITALVRDASKLTESTLVSPVIADAYDSHAIAEAINDHDAVISAFNPGWQSANLYDNFIKGSHAIISGTEASNVKHLMIVGGAGSLFVAPGIQLVDTPDFASHVPDFVVPGARAARDVLTTIQQNTSLDWTFISPPALLEAGPRTGHYRLGKDDLLMNENGPAGISVADFALAIVDEIETPKHLKMRFTVASR